MTLDDVLFWLTGVPAEDAARVLCLCLSQLAGRSSPQPFELEAMGVTVDDAMAVCSGLGLEEGLLELAEDEGWDCTDEDIERWADQLAGQIAARLARLVEQARENTSDRL